MSTSAATDATKGRNVSALPVAEVLCTHKSLPAVVTSQDMCKQSPIACASFADNIHLRGGQALLGAHPASCGDVHIKGVASLRKVLLQVLLKKLQQHLLQLLLLQVQLVGALQDMALADCCTAQHVHIARNH